MSRCLGVIAAALMLAATPVSAEPYVTIEGSGDPGNRVDLVVLGDGYTSAQLGLYAADVAEFIDRFFSESPFKQYRPYFNIHRVDVISAQSGADHPLANIERDTALGAYFDCAKIARLICVDTFAVNNVLARSVPGDRWDLIVVLVNDPQYGGSGGAVAVSSVHPDGVDVVLHEIGHSLGLLADEYDYSPPTCDASSEPLEPNVTRATSRAAVKWNHWIRSTTPVPTTTDDSGKPGLYLGGRYCPTGIYRPTYDSKMRSLYRPFEQINAEQLVKRIYNHASPIDEVMPSPAVITTSGVVPFSVQPMRPAGHALSIAWELDGRAFGTTTGVSVDTRTLSNGDHRLQVTASDPTTLVRRDPDSLLRDTRVWTIRVDNPVVALPDEWSDADIGAVGKSGFAAEANGMFTLSGAGADVWNSSDAFHFAYRPLTGDGTIVARVTSIDGSQPWTKTGVMFRASTSATSAHAFMLVSLAKGLAFQRRVTTGGVSTNTRGPSGGAPRWVRLQRIGNVFTASTSTDGTTWIVVGKETILMPAMALVGLAATNHTTAALATATFDNVSVETGSTSLPSGWKHADVGTVGQAGSASGSGTTFTVKGAGADVWDTADGFHFAYRSLSGNGTIVARVASISGVKAWTKMGVMIRASLNPAAPHAFMLASRGRGLAFQRRVTQGGTSIHTAGPSGTAPRWVKLERVGNVFTASTSSNGTVWTVVDRETISMPTTVLIGLAAHSHTTASLATGIFDGVSVVQP